MVPTFLCDMATPKDQLTGLADELLEKILDYLDLASFVALSRSSRRLYQQTVTRVYSAIHFDLRNAAALGSRPHEAALLLRTLLHNHVLAKSVETIAIAVEEAQLASMPLPEDLTEAWLSSRCLEHGSNGDKMFTSETVQILKDLWKHHSIATQMQGRWLTLLDAGRIEAIVACIVLVSTKMRSFRVGSRVWQSKTLDELLDQVFSSRLHESLSHVDLCPDIESHDDIHLHEGTYQCIFSILFLPKLANFSAPLTASHYESQVMGPSHTSTLQTLSLRRTQLTEDMLGVILQCTQQLKALTYWSSVEHGSLPRQSLDDYLDCEKLGCSLLNVKNTLVELSLSFDYFDYESDFNHIGFHGSVGSLKILHEFTQLTTVMAPYPVLLGWSKENTSPTILSDILPPRIQHFTLTDDLCDVGPSDWSNSDLVKQMKQLEDRIRSTQGSERIQSTLAMHICYSNSDWQSYPKGNYEMLCQEHGLHCQVSEPDWGRGSRDGLPCIIRQRPNESQRIRGVHGRRYQALHGSMLRGGPRGRGRGGSRPVRRGSSRGGHTSG